MASGRMPRRKATPSSTNPKRSILATLPISAGDTARSGARSPRCVFLVAAAAPITATLPPFARLACRHGRSAPDTNKNGRDCSRPFSFDELFASARRRGAGRGRRQRGLSAVEQRRDVADGDAPVDRARPVGLLLQVLLAIALRG